MLKKLFNKKVRYFFAMRIVLLSLFANTLQLSAQQTADSTNTTSPAVAVQNVDTTSTKPIAGVKATLDSLKTPKRAEKLIAAFDTSEILIQEGEMFSENMRVISNTDAVVFFKVDVGYPAEWRSLLNPKKVYSIAPGDTMYVPFRLVPFGKVLGNTKYMINGYLFDTIGAPITSTYIHAAKPKVAKWTLDVGPNKKIYFKNDSNETQFSVNVGNEGTEAQDIFLSMSNFRKDIILLDTSGRVIKRPRYSFTLQQFADTTMYYKVKLFSAARNIRRIDTEGHRPGAINETKSYSIFVKTTETSLLGNNARQMSTKMQFVKLPNQQKINPYSMYSAPLLMDFYMSNLFSQQPVASLLLRGNTTLNNGGVISYATQTIASLGVNGGSYITPPYFVLGYYDNKYTVMVGDVGGGGVGIGIGGKGIKGSYRIDKRQTVGAFYVHGPRFFKNISYFGVGANYGVSLNKVKTGLSYSHLQNNSSIALTSDYLTSNTNFSINPSHGLSLGATMGINSFSGTTRTGYSVNGGYFARFFTGRLNSSLSASYFGKYYTYNNAGDRSTFFHNSTFRINNRWSARLTNQYYRMNFIPTVITPSNYQYRTINNLFNTSRSIDTHSSVSGGLFYNILIEDFYKYTSHSRGISFNYNYTFPENYAIFGFTSQFGYSRIITILGAPEQFFMNLYSIIRYRIYSLNFRYSNGSAAGTYFMSPSSSMYAQHVNISFNQQYQFRNPHFILNNTVTYSLMPQIDRHSFGYTPELNYYTNSGWRIRVTAGYYRTSSKSNAYNPYKVLVTGNSEDPNSRIKNNSYSLMFGIRKEFGIPLPFIKRRYPSIDFVAFVDVNGNNKFDSDEARLENVVVKVDEWEVLTDVNGEAKLKNLPEGEFVWSAFSLEDLKGYFPHIPDKIKVEATDSSKSKGIPPPKKVLIPFVKGVKLVGKVHVDREKLSPDAVSTIDLSGIRVTALNGKSASTLTANDGTFMFYLPYGEYTISMDEKILGDRFRLLQNDIEVKLDKGIENLFISFYIAENQRKIKRKRFDANGNLIEDDAAGALAKQKADSINAANNLVGRDLVAEANSIASKVGPRPAYDVSKDAFLSDKIDATTTKDLIYTIQLGAFQKPLNPVVFKGFKNVMYERIDNEFVRIAVGNIKSEAEAIAERDNLAKVGFPNAFVSVYYFGKNITLSEAKLLIKSQAK